MIYENKSELLDFGHVEKEVGRSLIPPILL